jgi:hypothetical protein
MVWYDQDSACLVGYDVQVVQVADAGGSTCAAVLVYCTIWLVVGPVYPVV